MPAHDRSPLTAPLLFIGDLHGNLPFLKRVLEVYPHHHKVFVGDFVDSRVFSRDEELECLETVLDLVEKGDARALFGNHEWSYLEQSMRCSGFEQSFDLRLNPLKSRMRDLLEHYLWMPEHRILITHAGLSFRIWQECGFTIENLTGKLGEWELLPVQETPAGWIGMPRGGMDSVGGIYWCDWYSEFQPVPGVTQILGHTSALSVQEQLLASEQGIRQRGSNFNIDCLTRVWEVLEFAGQGELRRIVVSGAA
ncbi:MAG: metallophosphoesterase [Bacteroidota bacterium]